MSHKLLPTSTDASQNQAVGALRKPYTVSQLIAAFTAELTRTSNYPRHARAFVKDCLRKGIAIDGVSFSRFTAELPANRISPIRKFLLFYQQIGQPDVIADPPRVRVPPAANDLILRFIRQAKNLRGDNSKLTYTKALNAFFLFVDEQQQQGLSASLSGQTVSDYVDHLRQNDYSPFTINLYLSAIKQLASWCIQQRAELGLVEHQLNDLRDVDSVRGLAVERTFYKDSLEAVEREQLLAHSLPLRELAMLVLLSVEGLRTVELTRLRLSDLDFERQVLQVLGKGKNTRKPIRFFAACRHVLQAYLVEEGRWPVGAGQRSEFLFSDLKTYQIRYVVDKQLQRLGLKRQGMSAHSLRHTAGQLLLEAGISLEHVQQHLRHETLETTQFYTKKMTQKTYLQQMPD
ncbi:integrase/recombinase XerD [Spirosoma oryzae]|uniref:Integrase/recombinase XerD n=1 Tax=Spirosoma oryzae TaxID=1469603 RepID=A0A2T0RGR5_9BACT|nr:tyrosine-type recombinase/integrase [Spirosoma oryzae]PRY20394.1 integrase/recombinase XerD [Spirosoma oryzae]